MKKLFILMMIFLLPTFALAQISSFEGKANLVSFGGYFVKQDDPSNQNGYWYGAYADVRLWQDANKDWNIGLWALYDKSSWQNRGAPYKAITNEAALGLNGGYYNEYFSSAYSSYFGLGIGYKYNREEGRVEKSDYNSLSIQRDGIITGNLNLNLIKVAGLHPHLFPRFQIVISAQHSFSSEKKLSENNGAWQYAMNPWNKDFFEIVAKPSLAEIFINSKEPVYLQFKPGVQYNRYAMGTKDSYGVLLELSLHKSGKDDFFSFTLMSKNSGGDNSLFVMMKINLLKL